MTQPDPAIWLAVGTVPIPMLAALRDAVLTRSNKRMPKWKFRLTSDIVLRVQPRPATRTRHNRDGRPWFDCLAVLNDEADGAMLKDVPTGSTAMKFKLSIRGDCEWNFEPTAVYRGAQPDHGGENIANLRERLLNLLPDSFKTLRMEMMLQPACLCCGKRLTDPVSMARWFGPECAETSSTRMPRTFRLGIEVPAQL